MKRIKAASIGQPVIDEQHGELFRLLDQLKMAAVEQRTLLAVYSISRLKHYVREHFTTEESVMKQCKFPNLEEHIAEHEKFRAQVLELESKAIVLDVSTEMVEFLTDWLVNHIAKSDMQYVPYLKQPAAE